METVDAIPGAAGPAARASRPDIVKIIVFGRGEPAVFSYLRRTLLGYANSVFGRHFDPASPFRREGVPPAEFADDCPLDVFEACVDPFLRGTRSFQWLDEVSRQRTRELADKFGLDELVSLASASPTPPPSTAPIIDFSRALDLWSTPWMSTVHGLKISDFIVRSKESYLFQFDVEWTPWGHPPASEDDSFCIPLGTKWPGDGNFPLAIPIALHSVSRATLLDTWELSGEPKEESEALFWSKFSDEFSSIAVQVFVDDVDVRHRIARAVRSDAPDPKLGNTDSLFWYERSVVLESYSAYDNEIGYQTQKQTVTFRLDRPYIRIWRHAEGDQMFADFSDSVLPDWDHYHVWS
ncbi:hypothetical protein DFJ74DRAFT_706591 [Hyaloraphidium curvatum]|nr:hypothetical protein DFJ74DRAFT_706591 [Hyaloraphidium curvatum]